MSIHDPLFYYFLKHSKACCLNSYLRVNSLLYNPWSCLTFLLLTSRKPALEDFYFLFYFFIFHLFRSLKVKKKKNLKVQVIPHSICCCHTFSPKKLNGEFIFLMSNTPYKFTGKGVQPALASTGDSVPPTTHAPAWRTRCVLGSRGNKQPPGDSAKLTGSSQALGLGLHTPRKAPT